LLGEYIGRIYDEVRRRPLYVIHQVHQNSREQVTGYSATADLRQATETRERITAA